jgi:hypothetical protein
VQVPWTEEIAAEARALRERGDFIIL